MMTRVLISFRQGHSLEELITLDEMLDKPEAHLDGPRPEPLPKPVAP